ncbi:MAG: hypothetical protein H5U10_06060 [Desulfacinum sp.]|nr:hypothetical protein [Desulfacinum sp.]
MEIKEAIRAVFQELIVPELDEIRRDQVEMKGRLAAIDKCIDDVHARMDDVHARLDDVSGHLVDQSRRIDEINGRIDSVREELGRRIDEIHGRIDSVREELGRRIDETNRRLDRLYEVIVRREEHDLLEQRLAALERDVAELKQRVA